VPHRHGRRAIVTRAAGFEVAARFPKKTSAVGLLPVVL
jgi:hypothetical protein